MTRSLTLNYLSLHEVEDARATLRLLLKYLFMVRQISLLEFVGIQDLLGTKVDLVEYQAVKPRLSNRILSEEIRICG